MPRHVVGFAKVFLPIILEMQFRQSFLPPKFGIWPEDIIVLWLTSTMHCALTIIKSCASWRSVGESFKSENAGRHSEFRGLVNAEGSS